MAAMVGGDPFDEKIKKAEDHKTQGNLSFQEKDFRKALQCYHFVR